jgi:hypothetical protein
MTAECEPVFSCCGNIVSAKRCRLQAGPIAITQTVRFWLRMDLLDDCDGLLKELVAEEVVHTPQLQGTKVGRDIPFIESFQSLSFHSLPVNDHYHFGLAYSSVISFHYSSHND